MSENDSEMTLQNHRFLLLRCTKNNQFRVNLVESLEKIGLRLTRGSNNTLLTQSSRNSSKTLDQNIVTVRCCRPKM